MNTRNSVARITVVCVYSDRKVIWERRPRTTRRQSRRRPQRQTAGHQPPTLLQGPPDPRTAQRRVCAKTGFAQRTSGIAWRGSLSCVSALSLAIDGHSWYRGPWESLRRCRRQVQMNSVMRASQTVQAVLSINDAFVVHAAALDAPDNDVKAVPTIDIDIFPE